MSGCTTGKDISSEVIKCLKENLGLDLTHLMAICTDGAMNMTGINKGTVALLEKSSGRQLNITALLQQ